MNGYDKALIQCRGAYQRNLIGGQESWSGSTLRGKAKDYGLVYRRSRIALLRRLEKSGAAWLFVAAHNRLELRFGRPPTYYIEDACNAGRCWRAGEPSALDLLVEQATN
jgi:hypothetical protein